MMTTDLDSDDPSSEYFINVIDDTPELDMTVRVATPTEPGGLRVPTPTWRSDSTDDVDNSPEIRHARRKRCQSTPNTPTTFNAPHFPRKSSVPIITEPRDQSDRGTMGLFYRRAATPNDGGHAMGKVVNLRLQFEKIEREKIERQLKREAAARGPDSDKVPIYV